MHNYELGVKGTDWKRYSSAPSAGKAKYLYLLDVRDAWPDISFRHITCLAIKELPPTARQLAQREADAFSERVPLATAVRYWPGERRGVPHSGFTRTKSSVICDRAVVWVTDYESCISLSHVEVIE